MCRVNYVHHLVIRCIIMVALPLLNVDYISRLVIVDLITYKYLNILND